MGIEVILLLVLAAFVMETVDSSLGMMYGTLLSPILIAAGFTPLVVVPAILLSQALGGVSGTLMHQRHGNADFNGFGKRDTRVALAMIVPGLFVIILGVFAAVALPAIVVKTYIGVLVLLMSILCLTRLRYSFAWWKHYVVGTLAAFNKALTGGGFGPVTSTGGILGGLSARVSIATTTFAEVVICLGSWAAYMMMSKVDIIFAIPLCVGAVLGGLVGPYVCSRVSHTALRRAIGFIGILSGIWLLWRVWM